MVHSDGLLRNPVTYISLFFILLIPMAVTVWENLDDIEGKLWPVVKDVELVSYHSQNDGFVTNWEFNKARPCEYVSIAFYSGTRSDGFQPIPLTFLKRGDTRDVTRPTGNQTGEGWFLQTTIPPYYEQVEGQKDTKEKAWFADVVHRCHPFWNTRTRFWN